MGLTPLPEDSAAGEVPPMEYVSTGWEGSSSQLQQVVAGIGEALGAKSEAHAQALRELTKSYQKKVLTQLKMQAAAALPDLQACVLAVHRFVDNVARALLNGVGEQDKEKRELFGAQQASASASIVAILDGLRHQQEQAKRDRCNNESKQLAKRLASVRRASVCELNVEVERHRQASCPAHASTRARSFAPLVFSFRETDSTTDHPAPARAPASTRCRRKRSRNSRSASRSCRRSSKLRRRRPPTIAT